MAAALGSTLYLLRYLDVGSPSVSCSLHSCLACSIPGPSAMQAATPVILDPAGVVEPAIVVFITVPALVLA